MAKHILPNGYTVSVIDDGYGSDHGLLELAVWVTETGEWATKRLWSGEVFVEGTPDDVIGWLSSRQVEEYIEEISSWA
jgi:hypothetical protein